MSEYQTAPWRRGRTANATASEDAPADYSATAPTNLMEVTGAYVIRFRFFGTDGNNDDFTVQLYAVDVDKWQSPAVYMTTPLTAAFLVTLGNINGINNTLITSTDFIADTIAAPTFNNLAKLPEAVMMGRPSSIAQNPNHSPAGDDIGELILSVQGFYGLVVRLLLSGGVQTAVSANFIWAPVYYGSGGY